MAAIQYSEKKHETDEFSPDFEGKDDDSFSLHQNPTKTPIILKNFLRALPHCPIIHWASQMRHDPRFCFVHVQSIPVHGGITITSLFIMIMDAWWVS
jgi:hypothetical protein